MPLDWKPPRAFEVLLPRAALNVETQNNGRRLTEKEAQRTRPTPAVSQPGQLGSKIGLLPAHAREQNSRRGMEQ